jgi:hypothetical protein
VHADGLHQLRAHLHEQCVRGLGRVRGHLPHGQLRGGATLRRRGVRVRLVVVRRMLRRKYLRSWDGPERVRRGRGALCIVPRRYGVRDRRLPELRGRGASVLRRDHVHVVAHVH